MILLLLIMRLVEVTKFCPNGNCQTINFMLIFFYTYFRSLQHIIENTIVMSFITKHIGQMTVFCEKENIENNIL